MSKINDLERENLLKDMAIKALFHLTTAINDNKSEQELYDIYKFTLKGTLIEKIVLFVLDDTWQCKVASKISKPFMIDDFEYAIPKLSQITTTTSINELLLEREIYKEFSWVIPVLHKDKYLAYAFIETKKNPIQKTFDSSFIETLTNITIVAIENKKLVRQQLKQASIRKEMEIAEQVQSLLFPKNLPYFKELKIEKTYIPHDLIGGDYYDYIPLENGNFIFCIADVSGKGIPAALLMSNFQASLRTLVRHTQKLNQIVEDLNAQICENAQGEHFITFFIALYDAQKERISYINAGHNPPFFFDFQNNHISLLDKGTTILGIFPNLPFIEQSILNNAKNFYLFSYTDGITELSNKDGEQFGIDRLFEFIKKSYKKEDIKDIHQNLIAELKNFKGENNYVDDITLLSCRVEK
jgi:sigma-B regulation protein RsbU (phosphoserine phosphatase)